MHAPANVGIHPASHLGLDYAREDGTETWQALEEAVGALEGGTGLAFASGMGAASAAVELTPIGGEVAVPTDSYTGLRGLLEHAEQTGRLRVRRIHPTDTPAWLAATAEVDLLWLESPTNPSLHLMEIAQIAAAARASAHRPIVAVDNTFATPLGQQPLTLGADVVMHSATKLLGGHSDLLLGMTVTADPTLHDRLHRQRTLRGATPGALEAFLVLRGVRTLPVRLAEQSRTAATLAQRLPDHPGIARVRYPDTGCMLAFALREPDSADDFCARLQLIRNATSLGGVESTLEHRTRVPGEDHLPLGWIRFSVGLEDVDDLWQDLTQALPG